MATAVLRCGHARSIPCPRRSTSVGMAPQSEKVIGPDRHVTEAGIQAADYFVLAFAPTVHIAFRSNEGAFSLVYRGWRSLRRPDPRLKAFIPPGFNRSFGTHTIV